jgi:hypothetical protein
MKELGVYRFEEIIEVPIKDLFDYLNKDEHVLKWNSMIVENIYEGSEDDIGEGSIVTTVQKIDKKVYSFEAELIEYKPPYRATIKTKTKEGTSITRYRLTPVGNPTKLEVEASLIPSNWFYKILVKLTGWASKYVFDEQYKNFVTYVYEQENSIDEASNKNPHKIYK